MTRAERTATPRSLTDRAYERIEHMIIHGEIEPLTFVSEAEFMEHTGLGRTPVREAVHRLARERMVEIHPNRGLLITDVGAETEIRILELRRELDGLAVRLACDRATLAEREEIQTMAHRLATEEFTLASYSETVRETHRLVHGAAHNDFLVDAMIPLQNLSRRFWTSHVTDPEDLVTGAGLHRRILEAILERNPDAGDGAARELNDYLRGFAQRVLSA